MLEIGFVFEVLVILLLFLLGLVAGIDDDEAADEFGDDWRDDAGDDWWEELDIDDDDDVETMDDADADLDDLLDVNDKYVLSATIVCFFISIFLVRLLVKYRKISN